MLNADSLLLSTIQERIHFISNDDAIIDRPQPAGHDDADAAGVEQAGNLFGQVHADLQALELGAEGRAHGLLGVVLEGPRRRSFDVVELGADVGDVLFEVIERCLAQVPFGLAVVAVVEVGPVHPFAIQVGAVRAP